ncbi:MAG: DUF6198 family protein [Peptoniphilus sp.]|nr:DUF6198 family protein [Peptoniphilus sp.]MDD7362665.1 DUF6198 family protein [Bacillota bacterium]MDY6044936.1 DUF6198 family protein [Peptoniphilus sp.]
MACRQGREFWLKIVFFIAGVFINSFGIVLITKSNLGTSQISSISYVASLTYDALDFGTATFLLNVAFLAVQIAILRAKTDLKIVMQLPVSFLLGYFININMTLLAEVDPHTMPTQLICLAIGCIVLAFGISVEVYPDIVKIPGEGIVSTISKEMHVDFGRVKVALDVALVAIALAFSLASFGEVRGIGIGTVVSALFVGRMVNGWSAEMYDRYDALLHR